MNSSVRIDAFNSADMGLINWAVHSRQEIYSIQDNIHTVYFIRNVIELLGFNYANWLCSWPFKILFQKSASSCSSFRFKARRLSLFLQ